MKIIKTNFPYFWFENNPVFYMDLNSYPSRLLEEAVDEFAKLPGIGKKTALRLALHLLKQPVENVNSFGQAMIKLREEIHHCRSCNNLSDQETCSICQDPRRDHQTVCVVEDARDVMLIENTRQYTGVYHVLGGIISPMDGIGPNDLKIDNLENKIKEHSVKEIILALSTTMEGDTTGFYLFKKFGGGKLKISTIARGVALGDQLEYADELTLGRSILYRTLFEPAISK